MTLKRKKHTKEFQQEAVRLLESSGRGLREIAGDLGVAKSTLAKWRRIHRETALLSSPHEDTEKELARLRHENRLLRQERDLLKKATAFFARETSP
jgi:transposase